MMSTECLPSPDSFYVKVLKAALDRNAMSTGDRILVVCGGDLDEISIKAAGFKNLTLSNISGQEAVDVENLPFAAESFDAVVVHSGLHHCASPHRGLLEMYRVAKRCVVMFEPADNFVTWLGKKIGLGQEFEFSAVVDHNLENSGWRNTSMPNWVYRFTASEIRQTICANAPFGEHDFQFFYRTRIPWPQLRMRKSSFPLIVAAAVYPVLRFFDLIGPFASNNLAAVITKPDLKAELYPWLEPCGETFQAKRSWFAKNLARRRAGKRL
jgi:SAM-dependent methyltransferase